MKIAFDHSIFLIQKYGGISRYFIEVQKNFKNINNSIIFSPINLNEYLKNSNKSLNFLNINKIPRYTNKITNSFNFQLNNFFFLLWKPDIIHKTYFNNFNYDLSKSKRVLNVWDLSHEIYHKMYNKPSDWRPKKNALKNIDHVICSSRKTQIDLIKFYNFDEKKTTVIYQGTPIIEKDFTNKKFNFKFFLYVGSRKKYKNFKLVLKAFSLKKKIFKDYKLVCFGSEKLDNEELKLIYNLKLDIKDIIIFSGNDKNLFNLYKNAEALIYPSLNEGFGFPPLEAMSLSCPVIASNNSAIKECVGDCGIYFDPLSEEDLINCIEKVINNNFDKQKMLENGLKRSKIFSWSNTAKKIENVYLRVLGSN